MITRDFDSGRTQCTSAWLSPSIFRQLAHASQQSAAGPLWTCRTGCRQFNVFASVAGQRLQFACLMAGEKISVRQPPALQAALQQFHHLFLSRKRPQMPWPIYIPPPAQSHQRTVPLFLLILISSFYFPFCRRGKSTTCVEMPAG